MNKRDNTLIEGKLINAVVGGGETALWSIARGDSESAKVANIAIELATSPFHDINLIDAIVLATREHRGGETR